VMGAMNPNTATRAVEAPPPPVQMTEVLVAARRLPRGTLLRPEDFTTRRLPVGEVPAGSMPATEEARLALAGALLRNPLEVRDPVHRDDLINPSDRGFLAAVLRPGTRAISVSVDLASGTAGLIWPGDRVDLILTQQRDEQDVPTSRRTWGETVLANVTVIAVDQRLTQGGDPAATNDDRRTARTVTLEVTPEQAERVAVAIRLGRLSLVVRSAESEDMALAGAESAPRPRTVFGGDVSPALGQDAERGVRLRVIQGTEDSEVTFR